MDISTLLLYGNALVLVVTLAILARVGVARLTAQKHIDGYNGPGPRRHVLKKRYALALVLLALITTVSAVTLFQHTFPSTPPGNAQVIASACQNGVLNLATSGMVTGTAASMLFNCNATTPAITSASGGSSTPTFTLPTGATSLSLVTHVNNAVTCTGGTPLVSGTAHTFVAGDSLDYCMASASYPSGGIASYTVTWSQ